LNRAFSVCLDGDLNSWGDAPGSPRRIRPVADWFEIASLALKQKTAKITVLGKSPLDLALQNDFRVLLVVPLWLT
jgi:hypothetical protein